MKIDNPSLSPLNLRGVKGVTQPYGEMGIVSVAAERNPLSIEGEKKWCSFGFL